MTAVADLGSSTLLGVLAASGASRKTRRRPGGRARPVPGSSPEERNVAFLASTPLALVTWGTIEVDPTVLPARGRVTMVAGPGATPLGAGAVLAGLLAAVTPAASPPLDATTLAGALIAMNPDLAVDGGDWRTGRLLQVPIEIAAAGWETDPDALRALAAGLPPAATALASRPAVALPRPDPQALRAAVGDGSGHPPAQASAALLRNPSEELWRLLRVLEVAADRKAYGVAVAALGDRRLAAIGATTAGAAALRTLWRIAAADPPSVPARDALATALGLAAPTTDPLAVGPTAPHAEPPLTARQRGAGRRIAHGHVLGVDVPLAPATYDYPPKDGSPASDKLHPSRWQGWGARGTVDPGTWIAARTAPGPDSLAGDPADARLAARLDICRRIAPNEGRLDAANVYDVGIVSTGLQQWTARADDEMLALLAWLVRGSSHDYDALFGVHGLAITVSATFPTGEPKAAVPAGVDAGAAPAALPVAEMTDPRGARLDFFGPGQFTEDGDKRRFVLPPTWGLRVRLAAWASWAYRDTEALWAAFRFSRIRLDLPDSQPFQVTPGNTFTLPQLFSSPYGAALVLDQHVNLPGLVRADIRKAIKKAAQAVAPPVQADGTLNPAFLRRVWTEYQTCRRVDAATKANRDATIDNAFAQAADRQPGTFTAW